MTIQYSNDFKLSAVKLYLKFNSIRKVSKLLNCSKSSLQRWIERYFETGYIEIKNYKKRISIITNDMLKFIISLINGWKLGGLILMHDVINSIEDVFCIGLGIVISI
jgi:transposase